MTFLTVAQDFVAYFSWKKKELAMKKWILSGLILAALNALAFAVKFAAFIPEESC
ncbi:MAG: hypothetical protein KI786_05595 [Mameliella sp.]|nr:hypothetical protein [Phaeodactylibacter sp.]